MAQPPMAHSIRPGRNNAGSTTIDGRSVGNNSPFGANYLGDGVTIRGAKAT